MYRGRCCLGLIVGQEVSGDVCVLEFLHVCACVCVFVGISHTPAFIWLFIWAYEGHWDAAVLLDHALLSAPHMSTSPPLMEISWERIGTPTRHALIPTVQFPQGYMDEIPYYKMSVLLSSVHSRVTAVSTYVSSYDSHSFKNLKKKNLKKNTRKCFGLYYRTYILRGWTCLVAVSQYFSTLLQQHMPGQVHHTRLKESLGKTPYAAFVEQCDSIKLRISLENNNF